ncbi:hypothetical protein F511_22333 [Dorcoceras hygrometricum]|uniref:Uncharacterized protein n=1 Tax=Dorcoceras hygrometricum TaxID=472368 RepID=A0A2Z7AEU2_9LAMI|nr:hypothetical protein F511_22333 [Dorcoceras hygrometricum]
MGCPGQARKKFRYKTGSNRLPENADRRPHGGGIRQRTACGSGRTQAATCATSRRTAACMSCPSRRMALRQHPTTAQHIVRGCWPRPATMRGQRAWRLAPTNFTRKPALQTVGGGRSSIRSTTGIKIPPSICTRRSDGFWLGRKLLIVVIETSPITKSYFQNPPPMLNTLSSVSVRESRIQYLYDPQWFRDTASRGPTTIVVPESQFRTCPSDHDSIGYPRMSASGESSTTMHRLLHASGSHPIPPPNDPKTNQYNQDLGLIHSTNGNHSKSPNEGSSIDHQVTIYLHAQNITMFPTNETWYFASQITSLELGRPYPHFDGPID